VPLYDSRTWLELLGPSACWELLAGCPVGRLGIVTDNRPEVFPVNFAVDDRSIVFRTEPGTKLGAFAHNPSVCFEVDEIDVADRTGWSVLVKGVAGEITDAAERRRAEQLYLEFWARGQKTHWVRVVADEITGRRIHAR
jgi:nitroimidazol reductase NimA-like FMN-containing flavoprotein (pyridoxamine 5'-phosphate oxidase superfamily)